MFKLYRNQSKQKNFTDIHRTKFYFNVCSVSIFRIQYDFDIHELVRKDDNYFIIWLVKVNLFFRWKFMYLPIFHLLRKSSLKKEMKISFFKYTFHFFGSNYCFFFGFCTVKIVIHVKVLVYIPLWLLLYSFRSFCCLYCSENGYKRRAAISKR